VLTTIEDSDEDNKTTTIYFGWLRPKLKSFRTLEPRSEKRERAVALIKAIPHTFFTRLANPFSLYFVAIVIIDLVFVKYRSTINNMVILCLCLMPVYTAFYN